MAIQPLDPVVCFAAAVGERASILMESLTADCREGGRGEKNSELFASNQGQLVMSMETIISRVGIGKQVVNNYRGSQPQADNAHIQSH